MTMRGIRLKYLLAPIFVLWLVGVGVAVIAATMPTAALMPTTAAHKDRPLQPTPALIVRKTTNGVYAPTPPGPTVSPNGSVSWTYVISNVGTVSVNIEAIYDSVEELIPFDYCYPENSTLLAPNTQIRCLLDDGVAVAGQYSSTVIVTGTSTQAPSVRVVVTAVSHYFGGVVANSPGITMTKYTNDSYAPQSPGPSLNAGAPVTWTYRVTNTGNVTLNGIVLTDDRQGAVTNCTPAGTNGLNPGTSALCTMTGTAQAGQYANTATVTGTTNVEGAQNVVASDISHYLGVASEAGLTKQVTPTSADAGEVVTYTLVVTGSAAQPVTLAVTDTLPADLQAEADSVVVTLGAATLDPGTNTLHWSYTTTAGWDDTATITYSARVTTQCPTTLTNQARIFIDGAEAGQAAATVTLKSTPECDVFLPVVAKPVEQLPSLVNGYLDATPEGLGWSQTIVTKQIQDTSGDLIYADGDPFEALSRPNYAWLGGARNQTNQLRQSLTAALPANYAATLQFCYRLESAETAVGNDYVEIRAGEKTTPDATDNRLRIDLYAGMVTPGQQWKRAAVALDALKGKTITIEFFSSLSGALNSNFLVDNVKLCVPAAVPGCNAPVCATEEFCSAATTATEAGALVVEKP